MKKKVLTVCIGGVVRSVGLKDVLNGHFNCDGIAASAVWNDHETIRMLCRWADIVIPVEPRNLPQGPEEYKAAWNSCPMWDTEFDGKRRVIDLGPDIWGNARDGNLKNLCLAKLKGFEKII